MTKKYTLSLTLAVSALALSLPSLSPLHAAPNDSVTKARDAALSDQVALNIAEGLTTEVGQRMPGTEAEARARAWSLKKLRSLGFSNVRIETFDIPTWVRGTETAEITAPVPQKMAVTALGRSASTGEEGIEAEVVYFPTINKLKAAPKGSLNGKIAFVSHNMKATQDGSGYGVNGPVRWIGPNLASTKGAAAIVIRSVGTDYHRNPHTGGTGFQEGVTPIPAGALSIPDAENLARMFKRGVPVKMKLVLTPRDLGMQESGNVIAEVPGSDPNAGMILVAGHLDSWDLGTGAFDDAAGVAIVAAAAKRIMDNGKPKRTIRILWAGSEETGLWGGKDYAAKHGSEKHAVAMESDFGADKVWRVEFNLPKGAKTVQDKIAAALLPMGIGVGSAKAGGGPDVGPLVQSVGVSTVDLNQDGTRYFDLHHTPDDTFDKIDPVQMRQNVAAWTATLSILANAEESLMMEKSK